MKNLKVALLQLVPEDTLDGKLQKGLKYCSRLTAGNDFYVADLDTEQGNVKIGAMICYDREFI